MFVDKLFHLFFHVVFTLLPPLFFLISFNFPYFCLFFFLVLKLLYKTDKLRLTTRCLLKLAASSLHLCQLLLKHGMLMLLERTRDIRLARRTQGFQHTLLIICRFYIWQRLIQ